MNAQTCIGFKMAKFALIAALLFANLPLQAHSQPLSSVKVSLTAERISYEQILKQLEQQISYTFLYKKEDLNGLASQNLNWKNKSLMQVLEEVLKPAGLTYAIDDKVIIIRKANIKNSNLSNATQSERTLRGRVTTEDGEPLAGVTVYLKQNSRFLTQTNERGNYELKISAAEAPAIPVLIFTYIGMETVEAAVSADNTLNLRMVRSVNQLEETVIHGGYGLVQKRQDMVGSAFQITADEIKNLPAQRIDAMLEGIVPGLEVDFNTDAASSTRPRMNLRIRGEASLSASNEPLWIVDGVRVFTGDRTNMIPGMETSVTPLSYLNPNDIESITVLKDATMSSIYGADGANGVILVTTKKGRSASPSLSFGTRFGMAQINESTRFKVLDGPQYMELAKESFLNVPGNDMAFFPYQDNPNNAYSITNTDWYDVFYGTGIYSQNNITINGGNDALNYFISGEYFLSESTIKGNRQDRFSLRSNLDFALTKKLNLKLMMSASYNVNDIFNPGNDYYEYLPIYSPYNEDGSFRLWNYRVNRGQDAVTGETVPTLGANRFLNSVAEREENDNFQRGFHTLNNLILDYDILPGLKFTSQLGANYQSSHEERYSARSNWSGINLTTGEAVGYANRAHAHFLVWNIIERLNYTKQIGAHHIGGLLAFEASSQENRSVSSNGSGFANDHIREVSYASRRENGSSSASRSKRASFFGQANYNYDSRYYLTLNWRSDGNSDFGEDSQWGNFYSAGTSWNIHNEDFFNSENIRFLKFKASFGTNGNSRLGSQRAQGLYTYNNSSNYLGLSGSTMSNVWNRELSWEQSYMTNLGLRANYRDIIDAELEVYQKNTVDLLQEQDVTRATGDTRVTRNVGSTRNRGIELTVESTNIKNTDFTWTTRVNASKNENKLIELYQGIPQTRGNTIWMEGYDLNTYFLVRWAGVDPRDGAPLWYDANGNISRTHNNAFRVPLTNATPDFHGAMTNNFKYKNWNLSVMATYSVGGYRFTSFGRRVSSDGLNLLTANQSVNQLDRWQNAGDLALSPKPLWQVTSSSTLNSTRYLHDATNLRLKNVHLSYSLPTHLNNRLGTRGVSISLTADNLAIWTPYDQKDRNSYKQNMSGYPMERTISLGVNVQL